jgi:RNA ligase (TIGR02306 family)
MYQISKITDHPNADLLCILHVAGYQVVARIGSFKRHQQVHLIEADQAFTLEQAKALKLDYLKTRTNAEGQRVAVVDTVRLRGVLSEALVLPLDVDPQDFKFVPAVKLLVANCKPNVPGFDLFGGIENIQKATDVDYSDVIVTEKVHGTNSRIGWLSGEVHYGSRTQVREPGLYSAPYDAYPGIQLLFDHMQRYGKTNIILYGEIYGQVVQGSKYSYGHTGQNVYYVAFQLRADGKTYSQDSFHSLMETFNIPYAPVISGSFKSIEDIKLAAEGQSLLHPDTPREGLVITDGQGKLFKYVCPSFRLATTGKLKEDV